MLCGVVLPHSTTAVFTRVRPFLCRGEACLHPERKGDHQDRPYRGRVKLQTVIKVCSKNGFAVLMQSRYRELLKVAGAAVI